MRNSTTLVTRHSSSRSRNRHGWTLIELSVVISLLGVIGVMTTRAISLLMQLGETCIQEATEAEIRFRLEQTVRRDIHQTTEINDLTTDPESPVWLLTLSSENTTVTYRISNEGLRREQRVNNQLQFTEFFVIRNHSLQFSREGELVRLTFKRRAPDTSGAVVGPVEWEILVRLAEEPDRVAFVMPMNRVGEAP